MRGTTITGEFTDISSGKPPIFNTQINDFVEKSLQDHRASRGHYANQKISPGEAALGILGVCSTQEHLNGLPYSSKITLLVMLQAHLNETDPNALANDRQLDFEVRDAFQRLAAATPFPERFLNLMDKKADELADSIGKHPTLQKEHLNTGDILKLTHAFTHSFNEVFNLASPLRAISFDNITKPSTRLDLPQFLHTLTLHYTEAFFDRLSSKDFSTNLNIKDDETLESALRILLDPRTRDADGHYSRHIQDDIKAIDIAHKVAACTIQNMGLQHQKTGFDVWGLKEPPVTKLRGNAQPHQQVRR